jgi:hypothetical protein
LDQTFASLQENHHEACSSELSSEEDTSTAVTSSIQIDPSHDAKTPALKKASKLGIINHNIPADNYMELEETYI